MKPVPQQNVRVVFEGIPGAGKTTQVSRLSQAFDLPVIPEFVGFSDQEWRKFNLKSPFYFANDEAKEYLANWLADSLILFDRHYTGALAYGYALSQVRGATFLEEECYEGNFGWYQQSLQTGKLTRPDYVFVLDISPQTSLQRQPRARASDPLWGDPACLQAMREYYRLFYADIEPGVETIWIDGEQAQETVYQVLYGHLERIAATFVGQGSPL